ncbi:beta-citrylglutamate synthase B isoform X2 [Corvus hawaiiensis]|uniref:beta-citrylglutamate synthase B isoform X2 n=1 Tax=Corvus brachyrhynchos TaxID=85066 RepID=UPI0008166AEB|nr:PREDICTED: beta-citrylglutamate synthase B isoform X2 [Corvus brachyrhynchos]XP_031954820.1 beta-citrylglutamate synthase B isoform X2 [Corvus moneduloides]XP_041880191.1 beta-citrylglutamate synthase B isoform X2 [Corvus kubaryi]XP_048150235.1 beta-citrylglutamate synthase B isoform X2 [Corvus hawaiiensis]
MCSSVAPRLWFLTDRRIREDYPQQEILRALKAKCCEEELDFRALVMDEVVLTIEDGNLDSMVQNFSMWRDFKAKQQNRLRDYELENCVVLVHNTDNGLRVKGELITAYPQVVVVRVPTPWVQSDSDITVLRHLEKMGCRLMNRPQAILNCVNKFWTFQELAGHGVPLPDTFSYGKAVFLARDKHHLADLSHLIRHDAPYLFQKYVKESHGKDVRVIVVGGRVVGTMLRCSTDGRMQSNCSLGGVGMMCSLSEQGKQLAVQVSNILGMDVCGIDLLMKDDGSFYVCEANANVGFIAFDKACNLDVAGIIADYAASLLAPGRLTRRMSLLSVVSTASETSEPELGPPAGAAVDNMSASSSSVDSDPETTERELLTKLPGALFNMNQLLANEIKLLVE